MSIAQDPFASTESAPALPTVPKWPFILGDVLLLGAALGLWATQSPLSPLQTFLVLGAVGLGAVLFVMPFVMEYMTRTQLRGLELEQARAEDFQRLSALDAETRKQARVAIEAQEHAARATAALENVARKFDAHLAPLEVVQKSFEAASAGFQEAVSIQTTLEQEDLERRQGQLEKLSVSVTALAATLKKLDALADQPPAVASPDPSATTTLEAIHERLEVISHLIGQLRLPEPDIGPPPTRSREKEPDAGGSLLAKALATTQPTDEASAVARIIESRPRRPRKPKTENPAKAPESPTPPPEATDTASPPPAESPAEEAVAESPPDDIDEPLPPVPVELASETPDPSTENEKPEISSSPPPAQAELLDPGAESTRRRRAPKSAAASTMLVARVLIGIGNKPYVRGDGPGLSHSKGVPMEFVEIGQWRWVAPASTTDAISLRILKNDETPASGGPITLQPGQILEVNPEFPG
jgi:hypothetical protein